jgi:hypothetical protein
MVRSGVPAVVTMQFPITDEAAATFAQEFYKRLCAGEDAGQVDVAVTYARVMLAALHTGDHSWAAPVLYTHAADGVIYRLPMQTSEPVVSEAVQLQALAESLQRSLEIEDPWDLADPGVLTIWRSTLLRAEEDYRGRLTDPRPEIQQVARRGLAVIQRQQAAMDRVQA